MNDNFFKSILCVLLYLMLAILGILLIMVPIVSISAFLSDFSFLMVLNLSLNTLYIFNYFTVIKKLIYIIKTTESTPFIFDNVKNFKIMGYCLCINSIFEFIINYKGSQNIGNIQILATNVGAITPIMIACVISSLMCFVIAEIFSKAIKIKEDSDLTI